MTITRSDFDAINENDLLELRDLQVEEGLYLDYKADLYDASDKGKREFLKDATSFANTGGGHIAIGIDAPNGIPATVNGVDADLDAVQLRFESLLRDSVEPRMMGVRIRPVPLTNGKRALILRIEKSWNPPHAVIQNKARLIFVRNSAGVHEASVDEMRTLFTSTAALIDRAKAFQRERLEEIHIDSGPGPIPLAGEGGRIVLHVIPFSAFDLEAAFDPRRAHALGQEPLIPMWCRGMNYGFNADGYWTSSGNGSRTGYVQVFRNGIIEAAAGDVRRRTDQGLLLYAEDFEDQVVTGLTRCMNALAGIGVPPPMLVMLAGVRMYGTKMMGGGGSMPLTEAPLLNRGYLFLPRITLNEFGIEGQYRQALKPIFDAIWNAAGYAASKSYNQQGEWIRRT